ncbi:hypothetical protein EVC29_068 [Rhizobium phage RHph_Y52]|nr:hypothetical protein EVB53_066 [Rhizobium phage RHph_Y60]QIG75297.1 hypothetical protein EVC16_068 [Rhizobium phage RHph_Y21]QIG76769.1 hypothetical protein EVC29_068 [Rhizobium phage RHph_Y52]
MLIRSYTYADFKQLISLSTTEQLFHYEDASVFMVWARTISPTSYVIAFRSPTKPATFATDFAGSTPLVEPIEVS